MSMQLPIPLEFTATVTNTAVGTTVTLDTGRNDYAYVRLQRVQIKHSAGTAITFLPSIGNAAAYTLATVNAKMIGSLTVVADLFDVTGINAWFRTDSTGKFYLRPTPNAGADNTFTYSVIAEVL